jgi:hypothetical protein
LKSNEYFFFKGVTSIYFIITYGDLSCQIFGFLFLKIKKLVGSKIKKLVAVRDAPLAGRAKPRKNPKSYPGVLGMLRCALRWLLGATISARRAARYHPRPRRQFQKVSKSFFRLKTVGPCFSTLKC